MSERYKVVLIGESGVGKTCIIARFINDKFDPNVTPSITNQFVIKTIELEEGKSVTIDLWDTAGQERLRTITRLFYVNSKVVIFVYDVTDKKSFDAIKDYWYEQVKQNGDKDIITALVANKYDLYETRAVSNEEGEEYAKSIGAIFASTSAKNDSGIKMLFENIARKILDPDYDFTSNEQKKKDEYKKKKKEERAEINKANDNKLFKLNTKKEKKKKCC